MRKLALCGLVALVLMIVFSDAGFRDQIFFYGKHVPGGDTTGHFVFMGGLAWCAHVLLGTRLGTRRRWAVVTLSVMLLVALEEFSQRWLSTRAFSYRDLVSGLVGIAVVSLWAWPCRKGLKRTVEHPARP